MSSNLPAIGVPLGASTTTTARTFDHVPKISDLLVTPSGVRHVHAGVEYAQVCTHNQMRAQEHGLKATGGVTLYSIIGPKGTAEVALMCTGKPVPGSDTVACIPPLWNDVEIATLTGLSLPKEHRLDFRKEDPTHGSEPQPPTSSGGTKVQPGSKGGRQQRSSG